MAIRTLFRAGFARVVLALAMLAFVFVPTADAAICAPEPVAAAAHAHADDAGVSTVSQSEQAPDEGGDQPGEACLHGHCHHQGQAASTPFGKLASAWPPEMMKRSFIVDRAPPGADPTLPQRPPRG